MASSLTILARVKRLQRLREESLQEGPLVVAPSISSEELAKTLDDFPRACGLLNIRLKSGGVVPFDAGRWTPEQARFEAERTGRDIVVKPRQVGFSTLELARDFIFARRRRGVQVLVVAHDREPAEQLFLTIKLFYEAFRREGLCPRARYDNTRELVFPDNHSAIRIVEAGVTEKAGRKKGRSGTIHRLHATEVAFWGAPHATMTALMGAVEDRGEVVIESTAYGAGGLFYEDVQAARVGTSGYKLHFFPWYEHAGYRRDLPTDFDPEPRDEWEMRLRAEGCGNEQIAWWRSKVDDPKLGGIDRILGEYPIDLDTCFRASGRAYIEPRYLDAIAKHIREPIRTERLTGKDGRYLGTVQIFEEPQRGAAYVVGADVSEGVGRDACSATVLEMKSGRVVATYWEDRIDHGDFGLALSLIGWAYNEALIGPERNNHGHSTIRALEAEACYPNIYVHDDGKFGWLTNPKTRPLVFDDLAHGIKDAELWTPDARILGEARTLIRDEDGKPRARDKGSEGGCTDDGFVGWGIAVQMRARGGAWVPKAFHMPNL